MDPIDNRSRPRTTNLAAASADSLSSNKDQIVYMMPFGLCSYLLNPPTHPSSQIGRLFGPENKKNPERTGSIFVRHLHCDPLLYFCNPSLPPISQVNQKNPSYLTSSPDGKNIHTTSVYGRTRISNRFVMTGL